MNYITSQIHVMQGQEREEAYRCIDYLGFRTELGLADRQALCNWGYQISRGITGISRLNVVKAMSYFDRYMSTASECRGLKAIQLAFVASLDIALKVDAGFKDTVEFISSVVTREEYSKEEIRIMEMKILQALEWRLSGPTPHDFIDGFLEVIPGIEVMHEAFLNQFSKTVAEVAIANYHIGLQKPSTIAFGAICCGLRYLEHIFAIDALAIHRSLEIISGIYEDSPLKSVIEEMVRGMLDISLRDLLGFAAPSDTDSISESSADSPTSIFNEF